MSVEAPKTVEETPAVIPKATTAEETVEAPKPIESEAPATETVEPVAAAAPTTTEESAQEVKKDETVVEATPASEGVLGLKEPGLLKQLRFVKHYFWLSDEPLSRESLSTFRMEKGKAAHEHSAWAQETGKGVLFYTKRAEDKATPTGLILLSEAGSVVKEGSSQFSFRVGKDHYKFEAASVRERDSWIVALEKNIEEAKGMKEDVTSRESYKKTLEDFSKSAVPVAPVVAASRSKSKEPKKAIEPTETATKKDRSQSRKRGSIFGSLLPKKEEKDEAKEVKKEEKAEVQDIKKVEAEEKKEEAKETKEPSKAVEATEAAAIAAVPAAAIAAEKKEEQKEEEKTEAPSPTDKKAKRGSVFGSLFSKKVTSPTTEKSEKEIAPVVPAKDSEVPPVSETAPKIEEPIDTKPIDAAAVTAPADAVETPAAVEEPVKETPAVAAATSETATSPKTEKKGGFMGFIKKAESKLEGKKEEPKKEEIKEEAKTEEATEPAAVVEPTTEATATETTPAVKEERPAREKRRISLFGGKKDKVEGDETVAEKREKSPLPGKLGGLFRRPSKAVKSDAPKETTETAATTETPAATETTETTATDAVPETAEAKIESVPEEPIIAPEHAITTAPEVKATA